MRWFLLVLLAAACVRHPPDARPQRSMAVAAEPRSTIPARARAREAEAPAAAPQQHQDSLEAMEEQIYEATMYCIESRAADCPGGFACVDGACEPQS